MEGSDSGRERKYYFISSDGRKSHQNRTPAMAAVHNTCANYGKSTRFDLNAAIENWRQELAAQPNLASDDRRELETHLRDALPDSARGLNDEESSGSRATSVGSRNSLAKNL